MAAWFAAVVVLHAVAGQVMEPGLELFGAEGVYAGIGMLAAFVGLVAVWAVFGQSGLLERSVLLLAACGGYGALVPILREGAAPWALFAVMFVGEAAVMCSVLLVMRWFARRAGGGLEGPSQFTLIRALVGVGYVSLLFAVARQSIETDRVVDEMSEHWFEVIAFGGTFAVYGLVGAMLVLPVARWWWRWLGSAALFGLLSLMFAYVGGSPSMDREEQWLIGVPEVLIVAGSLWVWRVCGYTVRRVGR